MCYIQEYLSVWTTIVQHASYVGDIDLFIISQKQILEIVENNKNAAKTYLRNHPGLKNYEDILTVDFQQIKRECGNIDVIIGFFIAYLLFHFTCIF